MAIGITFGLCGCASAQALDNTLELDSMANVRSEIRTVSEKSASPKSATASYSSEESDSPEPAASSPKVVLERVQTDCPPVILEPKISELAPAISGAAHASEAGSWSLAIEVVAASLVNLEEGLKLFYESTGEIFDLVPLFLPRKSSAQRNVALRLMAARIVEGKLLCQRTSEPSKESDLVKKLIELFYFQILGDFSEKSHDINIKLRDSLFRLSSVDAEAMLMPALIRLDEAGWIDIMFEVSLRDCPGFAGGLPQAGEARQAVLRGFARRLRSFGVLRPARLGSSAAIPTDLNRPIETVMENTRLTATIRQLLFLRTLENTPGSSASQALIRHAVENLQTTVKRIRVGAVGAAIRSS